MKAVIRRALWICLLIAILSPIAVYWLVQDEAALDYSSLAIEIGPNDPAVNGYSLIREFAESDPAEPRESLNDYFYDGTNPTVEEMQSWINDSQPLLKTFRQALDRPTYKVDTAMRPETIMPDLGLIRRYIQLRIVEIDIHLKQDASPDAFDDLNDLHEDIARYRAVNGVLLQYLTAIAIQGMFNEQAQDFLNSKASETISSEALIHSAKAYRLHQGYTHATQNALKHEFQFTAYCTRMLKENPMSLDPVPTNYSIWARANFFLQSKLFFNLNETNNLLYLAYSELIEQASKPLKQRKYTIVQQILDFDSGEGPAPFSRSNGHGKLLICILFPAIENVLKVVVYSQANAEATRALYALRAYHLDHNELPGTLDALVPKYLDSAPIDPYDGMPLRYSKDERILYSVGNDFSDQGGSSRLFRHTSDPDEDDVAENDKTEPTFPIHFPELFN